MTGPTDHALHDIQIEIDERARTDAGPAPAGPADMGGSEVYRVVTRGIELTIHEDTTAAFGPAG